MANLVNKSFDNPDHLVPWDANPDKTSVNTLEFGTVKANRITLNQGGCGLSAYNHMLAVKAVKQDILGLASKALCVSPMMMVLR